MGQIRFESMARPKLDDFIAFTGWHLSSPAARTGMQVALTFYLDTLPHAYLMSKVASPSPWALPRGNVLKLCELMQAINFDHPVSRTGLRVGQHFKSYRKPGEAIPRRPRGQWFTELKQAVGGLGLPPGQTQIAQYVVSSPCTALVSTVSDAFTWVVKSADDLQLEPVAEKYFRGGGVQYFVWEPFKHFKLA